MSDRQEAAIDGFLLRFVAGVVLPRRRSRRPVEDARGLFAPDWPLTRLHRAPPHAPCSTRCPGRNWTRRGTPGHLLQPEAKARRRPPDSRPCSDVALAQWPCLTNLPRTRRCQIQIWRKTLRRSLRRPSPNLQLQLSLPRRVFYNSKHHSFYAITLS
jgi:hypothetical protein